MANKKIKLSFQVDGLKETADNVNDLEKNLEVLKNKLKETKIGSREFNELSGAISQADAKIKNLNKSFEGLDADARAGEMGKLAGGLGAIGTAAAMAFEGSEDAEKYFKTFAQGLAITNAIKGGIESFTAAQKLLRGVMAASAVATAASAAASTADAGAKTAEAAATVGATTAQQGLNIAMLANPIGIIVLAIGAVIAAFVFFKDTILDLLKVAFYPYILAFEAVKKGLQSLGIIQSEEAKKMEASEKAKTEKLKELHKQKMKLIKQEIEANKEATIEATDAIDFEIAKRSAAGEDTAELEKKKIQILIASTEKELELTKLRNESKIGELKILAEFGGIFAEKAQERIKEIQDEEKELAKNLEGYNQDLEVFEIKQTKIASDESKKRSEDRKKANDDKIKAEKDTQDKLAELREKAYQDRLAAIQKEIDAEANVEKFKFDLMKDGLDKQIEADRLAYRERFNLLNQFLDEKSISEQEYNELQLELSRQQRESEQAIRDEYDAKNAEKDKKIADEKKVADDKDLADAKELNDAKLQVASQGFNMIGELATTFAGTSEAQQKKAFNIKKAADISSATIDGYKAVVSTYANTPGGPVLKGIAAAVAGGFALTQIAKIKNAKYGGAGSGGSGGLAGGASSTPQPAPTPNTQTLFGTAGQAGGDSEQSGNQQAGNRQQNVIKAVVVESDITNSQNRIASYKSTSEID